MKVFLTGASGFVGSRLARILVERKHEVTAAVRSSSDRSVIPEECRIVNTNLFNPDEIAPLIQKADIIYHVAGAVKAKTTEEFHRINAGSTAAIVKAALSACPKALFVLTSSQAASGPCGTGPVTPYGRSKVLAEQALTGFSRYVILRPPAVLGPGDKATEPLFRWAARGFTVSMGRSNGSFCMISADDLGELMASLPNCSGSWGQTLTPAWPEHITWKRFHAALEQAAGRKIFRVHLPKFLVCTAGAFAEISAYFTGSCPMVTREKAKELTAGSWPLLQHKVEELTGWRPSRSPEQTLKEAAEYYLK
ncbi:hypothetical protein CSA37_13360 [Candidatus Fermentibacteria bacterium]|nr:MAG: hypothetical protein CSA37_13360 [Candidatus Fermentibacteria bacterium]